MNAKSTNSELNDRFNETLNSHGYPFQYAVIQAAKVACENRNSCWLFEASEFPVEVNGKHTRIDFILKSNDHDHRCLLVAECKRVNPAYGYWCFAKAPIVSRNRSADRFNIEALTRTRHEDPLEVQTNGETMAASLSYHIAVAVKDPTAKGNSSGSRDKDAIEKTASQVCMGANGLIELTANTKKMVNFRKSFIPVIFTTARLFASDCNLTTTDLSTGEIDLANSNIEEKHWLLYHYHLTPGIKHSVESRQSSKDLAAILDFNYIRTIPVVNANHIAEFLNFLKPDTF